MIKKLEITEYNPEWASEFSKIKDVYLKICSELDIRVEHVGSTSIIGCNAKPIIDIDIVLNDYSKFNILKELLESLGYIYEGEKGIKGRESFGRTSEKVPFRSNNRYQFEHHVYVVSDGSDPYKNHILFRDYLNTNEEEMRKYSSLKLELLNKGVSRAEYPHLKTNYIIGVLKKAGLSEKQLKRIIKENT